MNNWFVELSSINVNDHVKQKNGMNYLSWMWAWQELKKRYPLSYATVHETEDGMLVWKDPVGCHTKTSVTIVWEESDGLHEHTVTEYLPCMDFKNRSVPFEEVDSMLVNKTVQRGLTKCIARLGLGGYLFVNEDLPEEESRVNDLQDEVMALGTKKSSQSERARAKVQELCRAAEKQANPDMADDLVLGNPKNINDSDILSNLKKQLLAVRK